MTPSQKLAFCLIATISLGTALAQTSTAQTSESTAASSSSPVARVYVSRPTHVDAFDVSSSGKLTAVPGSPFSNISVYHMSVTKKFLFGASDDNEHILTYAMDSNGALKEVSSVDARADSPKGSADCCFGPQRLDATGTTLYNRTDFHGGGVGQEAFKIESNGALQFIGNASDGDFEDEAAEPGEISVLGNNKFAYQTGCNMDVLTEQLTGGYKRESSGALEGLANVSIELPKAASGEAYCPFGLATDSSDHLAFALQAVNVNNGEAIGPLMLASYTADSKGNLTTKNTSETLATVSGGFGVGPMSISPSGKLLALADVGFQVFHFNGADPITKFTGDLHTSERFLQFGWDNDNHLYALSANNLHVYEATSTEIKEVSGSPYSIPEASSVIVLSLK
jgi:hypothetical protein